MSMLRRVASVLGALVRAVFEPTEKERRLHVAESTVPYGAKRRKSICSEQTILSFQNQSYEKVEFKKSGRLS